MSAVRQFGSFDVLLDEPIAEVHYLSGYVLVTRRSLPDLRRALDWLEAEWGGGVEQPRLPLGPHDQQ